MHAHHLRNKQQNTEVSHSEIHGSSSHGFTPGSRGYFFLIDTDGALSNRKHGLFHITYFENGPLQPGYHGLYAVSDFLRETESFRKERSEIIALRSQNTSISSAVVDGSNAERMIDSRPIKSAQSAVR